MAEEKTFQLHLRRQVVNPERPPESAHYFYWTRVKEEVVLDIGFLDLTEASMAAKGLLTTSEEEPLSLYITHRFSLNREAQERLFATIDQLRESIEKAKSVEQPQVSEGAEDATAG